MPLSEREQAWAEQKIAEGHPKEEVFKVIASKRGLGPPPAINPPADPGRPPQVDFAQDEANRQRGIQQQLMEAGVATYLPMMVGPAAGGALAAKGVPMLPKALQGAGRVLARPVGEAAGQFVGSLAGQAATRQPLDARKAATAATVQGGLSLGNVGASYLFGRGGGVGHEAAAAAMGRPGFAKNPGRAAEDELSRNLALAAKKMPKTQGRIDLEKMIADHDQAGKTIDALTAAGKVSKYFGTKSVHPANKAADKAMEQLQSDLIDRFAQEAPNGQLTADAFDRIIREEFTRQLQKEMRGQLGSSVIGGRMVNLRNDLQGMLYDALGKDAASKAGSEARAALTAREKVQKYFGTDEFGDPRLATTGRVAASAAPANRSAATLMKKVQEFDAINGSDFEGEIRRLAQMREWGPAQERTANYISSMLQLTRGSSGVTGLPRNIIRAMGRLAVRSQGPVGAGVRGAAIEAFQRRMSEQSP